MQEDDKQKLLEWLEGSSIGELTTTTNTGIVNTVKILVDNQCGQLIHGGILYYTWYSSLKYGGDSFHEESSITNYLAVYYNGIQLVRDGKLHY